MVYNMMPKGTAKEIRKLQQMIIASPTAMEGLVKLIEALEGKNMQSVEDVDSLFRIVRSMSEDEFEGAMTLLKVMS